MFSPNSFVFHIQLFIHLCFLYMFCINTIRGLYRRSLLSQNVHKEANSKIHCDSLCYTGNKSRLVVSKTTRDCSTLQLIKKQTSRSITRLRIWPGIFTDTTLLFTENLLVYRLSSLDFCFFSGLLWPKIKNHERTGI